MSNKPIVVAVTGNQISDNIDWLSNITTPDGVQVVVIDNPRMDNGKTNFDFWIRFSHHGECRTLFDSIKQIHPGKVCLVDRLPKSLQAYKINAAVEKLRSEDPMFEILPIPTFSTTSAHGKIDVDLDDNVLIVVKRENGAKGVGQAIIPVWQYTAFQQLQNKPLGELLHFFPDLKYSLPYSEISNKPEVGNAVPKIESTASSLFEGDDIYVQMFLEIESEFRLIIVNGKVVHEDQRTITTNKSGYNQANMVPGPVTRSERVIGKIGGLYEDISKLCKEIRFEFGSMDLAITKEGPVILEYCNQFGVVGYTPRQLKRWLSACILEKLEGIMPK